MVESHTLSHQVNYHCSVKLHTQQTDFWKFEILNLRAHPLLPFELDLIGIPQIKYKIRINYP